MQGLELVISALVQDISDKIILNVQDYIRRSDKLLSAINVKQKMYKSGKIRMYKF